MKLDFPGNLQSRDMSAAEEKDSAEVAGTSTSWKERLTDLQSETSDPSDLNKVKFLRDLFQHFAITLKADGRDSAASPFVEIANSLEDVCILGREVKSSEKLVVYLPYLSVLHVVHSKFSKVEESSVGGSSEPGCPGDLGSSSSDEVDEDFDSQTSSLSTRSSFDGSILNSLRKVHKNGYMHFYEQSPLFSRKCIYDSFKDILSENRVLDVMSSGEILSGSYLSVMWSPVATFPRISRKAATYHVTYDLSRQVLDEDGRLSYPIHAMFSVEFRETKAGKARGASGLSKLDRLKKEMGAHALGEFKSTGAKFGILNQDLDKELASVSSAKMQDKLVFKKQTFKNQTS